MIVETARGIEFGTVVAGVHEVEDDKVIQPLKPVMRIAGERDIEQEAANKEKEKEAFKICKEKILKHGLEMKLIDAEYTFDNNKVLFYFTADGRIDFRELVKDLASVFKTRIELRQIGVRDETKIRGGIGICGRPLCCHSYLSDFVPVSIKMAKEQNLSLNPTKISGVCGRLMCCLKNEEDTYEELNRKLPGVGDYVQTADGLHGEVQNVNVLRQLVKVLVEGKSRAKLLDLDASGKYLQADVRPAPVRGVAPDKRTQTEALVRSLKECFEEYLSYSPQISKDVVYNIVSSDNPLYLSEYMPANLLLKYEDKQTILQENSIPSRLEKLLLVMRQECEVLAIEKELDDKVNVQMDKNQRDYYLREQMHIISEELGDAEDTRAEAEKYAQKIQDLHLDAASEEKLLKECERLGKMAGNQAEISVIRSYLDTVIGLPWHTFTKDDPNQAHARKVLDLSLIHI